MTTFLSDYAHYRINTYPTVTCNDIMLKAQFAKRIKLVLNKHQSGIIDTEEAMIQIAKMPLR